MTVESILKVSVLQAMPSKLSKADHQTGTPELPQDLITQVCL